MAGNRKQVRGINHIFYAYYTWLETENRSGVSITSSMPKIAYYTWLETENRSGVSITSSMPKIAYYTWLETENRSGVSITSSMPIIHGWKQKTGQVYQSHLLCLLYMAGNRKQVRGINHIFYAYYTWLETENRSGVSITSSMPKIAYYTWLETENRSGVSITSSMPKIAYYTWLETENRSGVSITSSMPIIHGWKQKTGQVYQSHLLCLKLPIIHGWKQKTGQVYQSHLLCLSYMAGNRKQVRCINYIFYAYYTWLETENRSGVSIASSMPIIHGWKQKTGQVYQSNLLCLLYMAGNRKQVRCINRIFYAYYTWLETQNRSGVSITSPMPIIHGWKQENRHDKI